MKGDCNADAFLSASTAFKKTYPRYLADNVSEIPDSTIFYSLTSSPIVFSTGSRGGEKNSNPSEIFQLVRKKNS